MIFYNIFSVEWKMNYTNLIFISALENIGNKNYKRIDLENNYENTIKKFSKDVTKLNQMIENLDEMIKKYKNQLKDIIYNIEKPENPLIMSKLIVEINLKEKEKNQINQLKNRYKEESKNY